MLYMSMFHRCVSLFEFFDPCNFLPARQKENLEPCFFSTNFKEIQMQSYVVSNKNEILRSTWRGLSNGLTKHWLLLSWSRVATMKDEKIINLTSSAILFFVNHPQFSQICSLFKVLFLWNMHLKVWDCSIFKVRVLLVLEGMQHSEAVSEQIRNS